MVCQVGITSHANHHRKYERGMHRQGVSGLNILQSVVHSCTRHTGDGEL